ncbi:MAG: hypothetical protein GY835_24740 [bacterium]|nr:hypothetical protein [bacterium]
MKTLFSRPRHEGFGEQHDQDTARIALELIATTKQSKAIPETAWTRLSVASGRNYVSGQDEPYGSGHEAAFSLANGVQAMILLSIGAPADWPENDEGQRRPRFGPEEITEFFASYKATDGHAVHREIRSLEYEIKREYASLDIVDGTTIVFLGDATYKIGRHKPVRVDTNEDYVLQAFIQTPVLNKPALVKTSGVENPGRELRRLCEKYDGIFTDAITLPGGKGKGGYRVNVTREK